MSQQPKTETDRLANVIQVLQLGQKTGRLSVERTHGTLLEQGMITFVNGQVVQAAVNQQQGPEALAWLNSWGPCRFSFTPDAPGNYIPAMPPRTIRPPLQPPDFGGPRHMNSTPLNPTGGLFQGPRDTGEHFAGPTGNLRPLQADQLARTNGITGNGQQMPQENIRRFPSSSGNLRPSQPEQRTSGGLTGFTGSLHTPRHDTTQRLSQNNDNLQSPQQEQGTRWTTHPSDPWPENTSRFANYTGKLSAQSRDTPDKLPGYAAQSDLARRTTGHLTGKQITPATWMITPYRSRQMEDGMRLIEHMGLSRTHRHLFLLIDGRRTLKELVRLMTYDPEEVLKLLQDLERAGVIQM